MMLPMLDSYVGKESAILVSTTSPLLAHPLGALLSQPRCGGNDGHARLPAKPGYRAAYDSHDSGTAAFAAAGSGHKTHAREECEPK